MVDATTKESILKSTKLALSVPYDDEEMDFIITMHINSVMSTLNQLGVGPEQGFVVEGPDTKWSDLYGTDKRFSSIQSYVYLRTRMLFDPPSTGPFMDALSKQIQELEWRINAVREEDLWNSRNSNVVPPIEDVILDGGTPTNTTLPVGDTVLDGGLPQ